MIAFAIFFVILLLVFTEFNTGVAGMTSVVLFKRRSNASTDQSASGLNSNSDEEKIKVQSSAPSDEDARRENEEDVKEALEQQPRMRNTFTWQHMHYEVPGRRLLNDISGYVAPGKLTALMGESGAGKVRAIHEHHLWLVGVDVGSS